MEAIHWWKRGKYPQQSISNVAGILYTNLNTHLLSNIARYTVILHIEYTFRFTVIFHINFNSHFKVLKNQFNTQDRNSNTINLYNIVLTHVSRIHEETITYYRDIWCSYYSVWGFWNAFFLVLIWSNLISYVSKDFIWIVFIWFCLLWIAKCKKYVMLKFACLVENAT